MPPSAPTSQPEPGRTPRPKTVWTATASITARRPGPLGGPLRKTPRIYSGHGEGETGSELPHWVGRVPLATGDRISYGLGSNEGRCRKWGASGRLFMGGSRDVGIRRGGNVASTSEGRICKAKTGNGRPCRNPVVPGSQLCGRHDRSDKLSPWWWTNAPELLRAWDEESLEVDERQRLELKRVFGPPRVRSSRRGRAGKGRRSTRRPSAVYRGRGEVDENR